MQVIKYLWRNLKYFKIYILYLTNLLDKQKSLDKKMVRKLKYHEEKLLKKVDFINWEVDNNLHEVKIMKKFFIQKREDYTK